ncbi:MAG: SDR family oxidoreductase [Nannocystaceae bacterium]|nr:SDR family oxidoreductase [bacterium]
MKPALIQGASRGIGAGIVGLLLERGREVVATSRDPASSEALAALAKTHGERLLTVPLDVEDEASIEAAVAAVERRHGTLGLLMNVAGLLHEGPRGPERRICEVDPQWLHRTYAVNAVGPLLVAKHFARLLQHDDPAVLANVSARVGSIEDDRMGGWYGYRASKAAQNMFTKNLSIELTRRFPQLVVLALHPGTVDTGLSAPFQRSAKTLFSVERAAQQLLRIVERASPEDNGRFIAWDGAEIPW